ncbi:MAG: hypothetical protein M1832_005040 [Thelocarpon impressellum]|nr:MAG: hypothetical protein M1832_005040 [Thelocarpon impressellum]
MPRLLRLAVAQARTLESTPATLRALEATARTASADHHTDLILFPEAYLGGYPRGCDFGAVVGSRTDLGREQFRQYFQDAVDLGDTPAGAGDDWVERRLPVAKGREYRGDGTREALERIARETGVFLVTGLVERTGGSLYCAVVYVCPREGVLGKRRKVVPTGSERLVWAQGSPSSLRAVATDIAGVRVVLAAAVCWENYMPLLRQALYAQNVNLYLAPTADARDTWLPLMRTIACEGRCVVLSANQCVKPEHLPRWIAGDTTTDRRPDAMVGQDERKPVARRSSVVTRTEDNHEITWPVPVPASSGVDLPVTNGNRFQHDAAPSSGSPSPPPESPNPRRRRKSAITKTPENHEIKWPLPAARAAATEADGAFPASDREPFLCRGGSLAVDATGDVLAGPLWNTEAETELLTVDVDLDDCERGRLDLDVAGGGSYSRDEFEFRVRGLDLAPPP